MNNTLLTLRKGALIFAAAWLASPAMALEQDSVLFVGDHGSYVGHYAIADRSLAVVIDGLPYKGHFSDLNSDIGAQDSPMVGRWGRAFLFASSAKVMQCALDEGFPMISGRCQDADGRPFKLMPASKL
ncbi:MAG: hypothetical protein H7224_04090 [Polaromonas sp.]|nr:hypothetical protein [Polaromonas sp.]